MDVLTHGLRSAQNLLGGRDNLFDALPEGFDVLFDACYGLIGPLGIRRCLFRGFTGGLAQRDDAGLNACGNLA
jgi:hypothetical protein